MEQRQLAAVESRTADKQGSHGFFELTVNSTVSAVRPKSENDDVPKSARRLQLARDFTKKAYRITRLQETTNRPSLHRNCEGLRAWSAEANQSRGAVECHTKSANVDVSSAIAR